MNPALQAKLNELEEYADYECWYLVKQPTKFESICYLVSFLKKFQMNGEGKNLSDFINDSIELLHIPDLEISKNYRALRVAAFFGLIKMQTSSYEDSIITSTFEEINSRCGGHFEKVNFYADIIQRQIEKMFVSTEIDEKHQDVRKKYRLYPVMLLYKILIEIGRASGEYSISMNEYRYIVATTTEFKDFWNTLVLIKLLRSEKSVETEFEQYRTKFDNRFIQALKQLPTLEIDRNGISLKKNFIEEVATKVFLFERDPLKFYSKKYIDFLCSTKSLFEMEQFLSETVEHGRLSCGENILLYGVPGSGKSWTIAHEYCNENTKVERLVFHPDYTYAEFVGQILPDVQDGEVTYKFTAGPFTSILRDAYQNPNEEYLLIIEEINRGNAPAIFGEVFQLLDRMIEPQVIDGISYPAGTSEYEITNRYMAIEIYGDENHKIRIPSNLSIIGTMNTSDQNIFTLDTAFQRRWNMRLIENSFDHVRSSLANAKILDTGVTWQHFCETVNDLILDNKNKLASAEDKRLGVYFVHESDLLPYDFDISEYNRLLSVERDLTITADQKETLKEMRENLKHNRKFAEKVIKYLWDDAFKFNVQDLFDSHFNSLESVIRHFVFSSGRERFSVFEQNVRDKFFEQ